MAAGATTNKLSVQVRTRTGKGASRQARREGKVPAVLYGHGADPQHLELNARDYAAVLRNSGTNAVLSLDLNGTEQLALTKALALHPVRRNIQHVDLIVIRRGEKVTVEVAVNIQGEAASGTLVNVVAAPTAEDLEAEGGGESVEEQAAEGEGTAEATADGESAQSESAQSE